MQAELHSIMSDNFEDFEKSILNITPNGTSAEKMLRGWESKEIASFSTKTRVMAIIMALETIDGHLELTLA